MEEKRINHYIKSLERAVTDDAKKGALMAILSEYSKSFRSVPADMLEIMVWLEEPIWKNL